MSKDEVFSKNLADIEIRKRGFLARKVEASDKERVDAEKTASGSVNLTEDAVCTWIECASDKKTWAELTEEQNALPPSWCHPPTTGTMRGSETKRPCSLVWGDSATASPSPQAGVIASLRCPSPHECRATRKLNPLLKVGPSHDRSACKKPSRYDECAFSSRQEFVRLPLSKDLNGGVVHRYGSS